MPPSWQDAASCERLIKCQIFHFIAAVSPLVDAAEAQLRSTLLFHTTCMTCAGLRTVAPCRACLCAPRRGARRRSSVIARALDPDNSSIMVCGGAGVAMHATRTLKDMGAWVWMLQRTENNRPEIEKMMAFLVKGDALETATIKKAMDGAHRKSHCAHIHRYKPRARTAVQTMTSRARATVPCADAQVLRIWMLSCPPWGAPSRTQRQMGRATLT